MFIRLVRFAWRNIMKNRRRTIITGLAVGFGLASMIFYESLMQGMGAHMIESTIGPWMGDAQIHRNGFLDTKKIDLTVNLPDSVFSMLREDSTVNACTARILSPASIASSTELKPVTLAGVDRETDTEVTMLDSAVIAGSYLGRDSTDLIIGRKLANDLNAELGDVIVITVAQKDSGLTRNMFFVSGICCFGNDELDRYTAFINLGTAGRMLGIPEEVHEIAVRFRDDVTETDKFLNFTAEFSILGNSALGWPDLAPQINTMISMVNTSMAATALILFGLVVFGIINSLFMSVYERMYEFGIMKALGTRPGTISITIILEAFWIAVISTLTGSTLGLLIVLITSKTGISFGEFEFSGVVFSKPIFPILRFSRIWIYPFFTLILTTAAGIYPGIHAGRLNSAEAIRKSL